MKSKFSKTWNRSVQPRRQRKYLANAPLHLKHKLMSANIDKSIRSKLGVKSLSVRKGDEVKVMRGKFKGKQGKILEIEIKNNRVQIDGLNRTRKDGEKVPAWFRPSKIKIINADDLDKKRFKRVKREDIKEVKNIKVKEFKSGEKK